MPDVVDVNLFFTANGRMKGFSDAMRAKRVVYLLNDENFVDCTNPANRNALFFAKHGCRDGENRQKQVSPTLENIKRSC
jgi:hypothetical protein